MGNYPIVASVSVRWLDSVVTAQQRLQSVRNHLMALDQLHRKYADCESDTYKEHVERLLLCDGTGFRLAALRARTAELTGQLLTAQQRCYELGDIIADLVEVDAAIVATLADTRALIDGVVEV